MEIPALFPCNTFSDLIYARTGKDGHRGPCRGVQYLHRPVCNGKSSYFLFLFKLIYVNLIWKPIDYEMPANLVNAGLFRLSFFHYSCAVSRLAKRQHQQSLQPRWTTRILHFRWLRWLVHHRGAGDLRKSQLRARWLFNYWRSIIIIIIIIKAPDFVLLRSFERKFIRWLEFRLGSY